MLKFIRNTLKNFFLKIKIIFPECDSNPRPKIGANKKLSDYTKLTKILLGGDKSKKNTGKYFLNLKKILENLKIKIKPK